MLSDVVKGMLIFCVLLAGFALLNLTLSGVVQQLKSDPGTEPVPAVTTPVQKGDGMCGRYHYRKRTNRFFRRSVG